MINDLVGVLAVKVHIASNNLAMILFSFIASNASRLELSRTWTVRQSIGRTIGGPKSMIPGIARLLNLPPDESFALQQRTHPPTTAPNALEERYQRTQQSDQRHADHHLRETRLLRAHVEITGEYQQDWQESGYNLVKE